MSRLDYITIGIVAACILAIIFLVYKMTDLFNEAPKNDPIENPTDKVEEEDDGVYDYETEDGENDATSGGATTDDESSTGSSSNNDISGNNTSSSSGGTSSKSNNTSDEEAERTPPSRPSTFDNSSSRTTSSSGKYMVIAGTFAQRANAQSHLSKLKKLGYNSASVENFDRGKYAVVLVDRFDSMAGAERLVKDLKAENIPSYVKVKEAN